MECIFCKIVKGELPCAKIYEDDRILAFLDISPVNKGHILVIAKEHYDNSLETPDELLAEIAKVVKKIAFAQKEALGAAGVNFGINNGAAAGQVIFHTHWHVIPRFKDDGLKLWGSKEYESDKERDETAEKIKNKL